MLDPIRLAKSISNPSKTKTSSKILMTVGIPFSRIQNSGGAQIIARKMARRKGKISDLAEIIPATITTKAARFINILDTLALYDYRFMNQVFV